MVKVFNGSGFCYESATKLKAEIHLLRKNEKGNHMIRKRIVFYGSVQGVGFRWRARQAAYLHSCTGWCLNEPDGSVIMEIQGTEEQIDQVILTIEASRYVEIKDMKVDSIPLEESERGFWTD